MTAMTPLRGGVVARCGEETGGREVAKRAHAVLRGNAEGFTRLRVGLVGRDSRGSVAGGRSKQPKG